MAIKGAAFRDPDFFALDTMENPSNTVKTPEKKCGFLQVHFLLRSNFQTNEGTTSTCTNNCMNTDTSSIGKDAQITSQG